MLDLSVNAIGAEGIGALSQLPCLKELDISRCASALPRPVQPPGPARAHDGTVSWRSNGLTALPPMASGFTKLTKLAASDNHLSGDAVLENLAGIAQCAPHARRQAPAPG